MKKKIKDLTLKEVRMICGSHNCEDCPLYYGYGKWCYKAKLETEEIEENFDLEKEVEVK